MYSAQQNNEFSTKVWQFLALVMALFLLRSLVTFPVEHHDATLKYLAAAEIARSGDWGLLLWDHHTMRWAEMVPQTLITMLAGIRYEAVYIYTLLAFATGSALIIMALKDRLNPLHTLLLAGLLFFEPLSLMHTGQLMNPPFGVMFSFAGILILLGPGRNNLWGVSLAACMFFCAYGSHVTYLSFAAGGFFWLWWRQGRPAAAVLFAATLLALFAVETLAFNSLSDGKLTLGRIEALSQGKHVSWVHEKFKPVEYHHLFTRWLRVPRFDQLLALGFITCGAWLLWNRKARERAPDFLLLAMLTGTIFALSITFAIAGFNPLRPAMPLIPMYLQPFFPYAIIGSVWLYASMATRIRPRLRLGLELAGGLAMGLLLLGFVLTRGSMAEILNNRVNAFMWQSERELGDFADRFASGELKLVGRNRMSLSFVVRYRHPMKLNWDKDEEFTSVPSPNSDAQCLTHIRKIPLERNYQDCGTIQIKPRRKRKTL